jgi:radical SAM protein with 4Fe4S-binding SPASM domain
MVVGRVLAALKADLAGVAEAWRGHSRDSAGAVPGGLHTYRFEADGGLIRLHLRRQPDGTGMLFRDVSDVVHLSPTATEMCWLALEGFSQPRAVRRLARRYRGVGKAELVADFARMRRLVTTLGNPGNHCATCAADLPQRPLFSVRGQAPHKVDIALTYACNNLCPHCYNDPSRFDLDSLAADEWRRLLDTLAEIGVPHVIFTGGEATLHPALPELVAHADGLGQIVGLNSNGRRFARHDMIGKLAAAGLDHVQVTLESHRPEVHNAMVAARAFDQTVAGIRAALEVERLHVITNTTITRVNAPEIEETVAFLHGLGLRTFAMNGLIYSGGGNCNPDALPSEAYPPILVRVRDVARELGMRFLWYTVTPYCEMSPLELEIGAKRCNAGEYSMCVEPNGDVLPCQSFYTTAGNLLRDPWERIWRGPLFRSFRERERDPNSAKLPEMCWDCPDLPLCGGGCRIEWEARATGSALSACGSCASGGGCDVRRPRSSGLSALASARRLGSRRSGDRSRFDLLGRCLGPNPSDDSERSGHSGPADHPDAPEDVESREASTC